ncbi:MAG: TldD/PmbA family protein [Desulfurococcales archaeon]|nr:TldD/PmbA family protein [Desulfurococcales archaeon]
MSVESFDPDILEVLVSKATSNGAGYAEARFHSLYGNQIGLMNGRVYTSGYEEQVGVAVRVIVNGGLGFASTDKLDRDTLLKMVDTALSNARISSGIIKHNIEIDDSRLGSTKYDVYEKKPLESLNLVDKLGEVKERADAADLSLEGIQLKSFMLFYNELAERKIIVTSDGGYVEANIPRAYVHYNLTASNGSENRNRYSVIAWTGGFEGLDRESLTDNLEDDMRSLGIALTKAKPSPKGKMDVVLGPELSGIAVHESIGHPSEADRILGREAAQAGLSYWRDYSIGDRIGSDVATVVDDPTIPGAFGFYLYDDEAVPARPRHLLYKGLINEMLQNRETGRLFGSKSNGAARARDFKSEPIIRMANTYFAPGDYSFNELIEDVNHGIYIEKYMEWNIDDYRWGARYVGLEAYVIENGHLREPVKDPILEITSPAFYSSVDAVGDDLKLYPGFCGKGEPIQGVPVTMGGPHIRLREVVVK